jgi:transmembrane sensor
MNRSDFSNAPETTAARWVDRRRAGLDPAGERELSAWLAAAPENAVALQRLEAMADVFVRVRAQGAAPSIAVNVRRRVARRRGAALALAAAVVLAGGLFIHRVAESTLDPVAVPTVASANTALRQRLPDGSLVEARPGAEFTVHYAATVRRIALERGEAWFQVEPDTARPFVVEAAGLAVRAVGTAFQVRIEPEMVGVLVTHGKVRVDDAAQNASVLPAVAGGGAPLLVAGQEAVVVRGDARAQVLPVAADDVQRRLAWRVQRLAFDGMELARAAEVFNRANRTQLALADASLAGLRISGDFAPDDPETFARLAAATFGLRLERDGADRLVFVRE